MPRGQNQTKLPTRIYFIEHSERFLGPYTSRPTLVFKNYSYEGSDTTMIVYEKDANDNYIKVEDNG